MVLYFLCFYVFIFTLKILFYSLNIYLFLCIFMCEGFSRWLLHLKCHTPNSLFILGSKFPSFSSAPQTPQIPISQAFYATEIHIFHSHKLGSAGNLSPDQGTRLQLPRDCKLIFVWQEQPRSVWSEFSFGAAAALEVGVSWFEGVC